MFAWRTQPPLAKYERADLTGFSMQATNQSDSLANALLADDEHSEVDNGLAQRFADNNTNSQPSSDSGKSSMSETYAGARRTEMASFALVDESGTTRSVEPVKLELQNMSYWVGTRRKTKCIMHNVSAGFYPGETCALMGPSGAGKTTLLNVLSSRAGGRVEGKVLLNNEEASADVFKSIANYVPQEDDMLVSLTPRRQLDYVAELRMPADTSACARRAHIDDLLHVLRLEACQHVIIGSGTVDKGISGGQKKRVSIAMELVNEPSVLFLDEPTSGLDSAMAQEVVSSVRALSRRGLNVVCTIHQPSQAVFLSFDELCLLFQGRLVYHGAPPHAGLFFCTAGLVDRAHLATTPNPADLLLGALVARSPDEAPLVAETWLRATRGELSGFFQARPLHEHVGTWHNEGRLRRMESAGTQSGAGTLDSTTQYDANLLQGFVQSKSGDASTLLSLANVRQLLRSSGEMGYFKYPISRSQQFNILLRRACSDHYASKMRIQLRVAIGLGLLYGLVFFKLENTQDKYDMRLSALFMSVIYNGMMCVSQASILVPLEKRVLLREYQNGAYAVLPYFAATIGTRILFQALASSAWAVPFYLMAGLRPGVTPFLTLLVTVCLLAYIALVYGFMIGTIAHSPQKAQQLLVPSIMPLIIFCGFLIQRDGVRPYFLELWYLSFFRYAFAILVVNEFSDGKFDPCQSSAKHFCPLNAYSDKPYSQDAVRVDRKYVITKIMQFRTDAIPTYLHVLLFYAFCISFAGYQLLKFQARRRYG